MDSDDQRAGSSPVPSADEIELERALFRAVAEESLSVVYQPLVRSGDGTLLGLEVLLRWVRPGVGTVSPAEFIPVAERCGLMPSIGAWVLREGCAELALWSREGLSRDLVLHVNLSRAEIVDGRLDESIKRALVESGLTPERICVEVTEPVLLSGGEPAEAAVHRLTDMGVRLCLDDFGTNSSIAALTRYQFDHAKVGRQLIGGLDSPAHRARLIRGLLGMAKALGTTLIAEGIEHGEELDRVAALGISEIQGYATGRPASGEALRHAFRQRGSAAPLTSG